MTSAAPAGCDVLPAAAVGAYADGSLEPAAEWSVEAHLPGCPACRAVLAGYTDADRLAANRGELLARIGLPKPGLIGRMLRRCWRAPEHVTVLLRGDAVACAALGWQGVLLVLAVAVGVRAAQLPPGVSPALRMAMFRSPGMTDWAVLVPLRR